MHFIFFGLYIYSFSVFAVHINTEEQYSQVIPSNVILNLTTVSLEDTGASSSVIFYMHDGDEKYAVCHLRENGKKQHNLKFVIEGGNELKCSIDGNGVVSLTGWYEERPNYNSLPDFVDASEFEAESSYDSSSSSSSSSNQDESEDDHSSPSSS